MDGVCRAVRRGCTGRMGRDMHGAAQGAPCKILEILRGYGERGGHPVLFFCFESSNKGWDTHHDRGFRVELLEKSSRFVSRLVIIEI